MNAKNQQKHLKDQEQVNPVESWSWIVKVEWQLNRYNAKALCSICLTTTYHNIYRKVHNIWKFKHKTREHRQSRNSWHTTCGRILEHLSLNAGFTMFLPKRYCKHSDHDIIFINKQKKTEPSAAKRYNWNSQSRIRSSDFSGSKKGQ